MYQWFMTLIHPKIISDTNTDTVPKMYHDILDTCFFYRDIRITIHVSLMLQSPALSTCRRAGKRSADEEETWSAEAVPDRWKALRWSMSESQGDGRRQSVLLPGGQHQQHDLLCVQR